MKEKERNYVFRFELEGGNYSSASIKTDSRISAWSWIILHIRNAKKLRDLKGIQLVSSDEVAPPWDE